MQLPRRQGSALDELIRMKEAREIETCDPEPIRLQALMRIKTSDFHSGLIITIAFSMLLSACVVKTHALNSAVKHYRGDGIIEDISIGSVLFMSPGFRISFPEFDARRPYSQSYRLSGVPKTGGHKSVIYLRFNIGKDTDIDKSKSATGARFSFSIADESGAEVKSESTYLRDATWGSMYCASGAIVEPFWEDKSKLLANVFAFDPSKNYTLTVLYIPSESPPPTKKMRVTIKYGGNI